MKKLFIVVALVGFVATVALSGCNKQETAPEAPATPAAPSTNAPAE